MNFSVTKFFSVFREAGVRRDLTAFIRFLLLLVCVILVFSLLFQVIMVRVEGRSFSWITAVYWTVVTMSTLGEGEVVFLSDLGRIFTLIVLISGILLILVLLPFTFIRFFYAPWLKAQLRLRAPRELPSSVRGHVVITNYDEVAIGLIERLQPEGIPYVVLEPDVEVAARLHDQGVLVVTGEFDSLETYNKLHLEHARLVLANREDTTNTNITLTVREASASVPIVGLAEDEDSIDILDLSGCTHVLPLKIRLGEYLGDRASAGVLNVDLIGELSGLQIAEFSARNTPLVQKTVRESKIRNDFGINIIGLWHRGELLPAFPTTVITDEMMVVIVGEPDKLSAFDAKLETVSDTGGPVLVIGGGKVGRAAIRELKRKGVRVHVLERDPATATRLQNVADLVHCGDANDREALRMAGLDEVRQVLLTSNDDAANIYLSVYCRRLKPTLRVISRISRDRNLGAIRRAGADFMLSYSSLGADAVMSFIGGHNPVILGAGIELFSVVLPVSLGGKTLAQTEIASRTGLSVVAVQHNGKLVTNLRSSMRLEAGSQLFVFGDVKQRRLFFETFG